MIKMKRYSWKQNEISVDNPRMLVKCQNQLIRLVCSEDFLSIKMLFYSVGTSTETKKLLFILIKKTEGDIIILSVNHEEVNLYSLVI
jgi:murein L,D-transpeptidase YafK